MRRDDVKADVVQASSLYRQGVVVPVSKEAAARLVCGGALVDGSDVARYVELSAGADAILWTHGFFDAVNQSCGLALSEYEEEAMNAMKFPPFRKL